MLHTAEAVAVGHPDKVCDQIADALVDECLAHDSMARCAIEAVGGHGKLFIMGELTTTAPLTEEKVKEIALRTYKECGYTDPLMCLLHLRINPPRSVLGLTTTARATKVS